MHNKNHFVWNFLCKEDAMKKKKTLLTSKVKQKLKCSGIKKIYIRKETIFLAWNNVMSISIQT